MARRRARRAGAPGTRAHRAVAVVTSTLVAAALAGCSGGGGEEAGPTPRVAPPPDAVELTLAFGGDILPFGPVLDQARVNAEGTGTPYDFAPMLAPLRPVLDDVDLALCHLEVPLVGDGQEVQGYPFFHAPRELVPALAAAGYDGCSTASNHSLDGGVAGIDATLDAFDAAGLGHAGTSRDPAGASTPAVYEVGAVRIAHLSYTYGLNEGTALPDAPWAVEVIDRDRIIADARAARADGARLVVVSLHWGNQYRSDPSPEQQALAATLSHVPEVDLVVGHHIHLVQPVEELGGTWFVYGLGNQLTSQTDRIRREGLTAVVTVGGADTGPLEVRRIEAVPTLVDPATMEVLPMAETLAQPDLDAGSRATLEGSLGRVMATVNRRGADVALRTGP